MKLTINKTASTRLLEAFAQCDECFNSRYMERRMESILDANINIVYYTSPSSTHAHIWASTGPEAMYPVHLSVDGPVTLRELAVLVSDALPSLAVGVVTYNSHMQPSIN